MKALKIELTTPLTSNAPEIEETHASNELGTWLGQAKLSRITHQKRRLAIICDYHDEIIIDGRLKGKYDNPLPIFLDGQAAGHYGYYMVLNNDKKEKAKSIIASLLEQGHSKADLLNIVSKVTSPSTAKRSGMA